MKEFADDDFMFDENGKKLSKWIENTVGKGEIARHEQFLLFPQSFQKTSFDRHVKSRACFRKDLNIKFTSIEGRSPNSLYLILISLDSASWELHQYSHRMCGRKKNP